jgi:hypothetical protein
MVVEPIGFKANSVEEAVDAAEPELRQILAGKRQGMTGQTERSIY